MNVKVDWKERRNSRCSPMPLGLLGVGNNQLIPEQTIIDINNVLFFKKVTGF